MDATPFAAVELSGPEFDDASQAILQLCRRMSVAQVLDVADQMHDVIRTRQVLARAVQRRQTDGLGADNA